jgi:peroxiredoxin
VAIKKNTLASFIVLSGLVAVPFAMAEERPLTSSGLQRPEGVKLAPPFLLKDLDGKEQALDDYKGRVILIHFWATWCVPCKDELPTLRALWERLKDRGFAVVAIAADSKKAVLPFTKEHGLRFPVLIDQYGSALRAYRAWALPASYVVGKAGTIEWIALGPRDWTSPEVTDVIEGLLKE